jgi:hypothetical protein
VRGVGIDFLFDLEQLDVPFNHLYRFKQRLALAKSLINAPKILSRRTDQWCRPQWLG